MALLNEEHGRFKTFSRRTLLLGGSQVLLLAGLAGRLYHLQIVENERYATLAEENRVSLRLLAPPRGRILDRYGGPVAVNEHNYRVMLVAEKANDVEATLDKLARIIPIPDESRARILEEVRTKRPFVPVLVQENLSWEKVSRIEVNAPELGGIQMDVGQTRAYPFHANFAHVVGYVGPVSKGDLQNSDDPLLRLPGFRVGKAGMEQRYDTRLRGSAGRSLVTCPPCGLPSAHAATRRRSPTAPPPPRVGWSIGLDDCDAASSRPNGLSKDRPRAPCRGRGAAPRRGGCVAGHHRRRGHLGPRLCAVVSRPPLAARLCRGGGSAHRAGDRGRGRCAPAGRAA